MSEADHGRFQDRAEERQHERAERVESTLESIRADLGEATYPVESRALAEEYLGRSADLPETVEPPAAVFERLGERFADPEAAFEAYLREAAPVGAE